MGLATTRVERTRGSMWAFALPIAVIMTSISGTDAAQPVGPCQSFQICRFSNPEDLADLASTSWIIVSQQSTENDSGLAAYDTMTGVVLPLHAADAPTSPYLDGDPACHRVQRQPNGGLDIERAGDEWRLAVVSRGDNFRIEYFRIVFEGETPTLRWSGCVAVPRQYMLNDVALTQDGLVASHMFDPKATRAQREAMFLNGAPTGFIVRWTRADGWTQISDTDGTFPNGVVAAPGGAWIAFAETYGRAVNRIAPDGSGRRRIRLPMQPDNVTLAGGDSVIVAGGTGEPIVSTRDCATLRKAQLGCGFPAAAIEVNLRTGETRRLATSDGTSVPGISVALRKDGVLYLGTAYGDRITRVRPPVHLP